MTSQPSKSTDSGETAVPSGQENGSQPKKKARNETVEVPTPPPSTADHTRPDGSLGDRPVGGIGPVKDDAEQTPPWAKAPEPGGSMSAGRAEPPAMMPPNPQARPGPAGPRPGPQGPAGPRPAAGPPGATADTAEKNSRKAHLQLAKLEPWSVMKFSFVMSLVCFVVLLVAVTVLYIILSGLGVFNEISTTVNDLTREQGQNSGGLDAASWFSFARVFGYTVLVGALNVLLITALTTVGAVIYNLAADLVGGVEVTLKEAE